MKVATILVAFFLVSATAAAATSGVDLSESERVELLKVAAAVRGAILNGDVVSLLRFISKGDGLECTDSQYRYGQVAKDLRNKRSFLYMSLFNSEQFSAQCGEGYPAEYPAISDREFFAKSPNSTIEITFASKGQAEVTFHSGSSALYPRKYDFHRESKGWRLVGGLIIGECTCG